MILLHMICTTVSEDDWEGYAQCLSVTCQSLNVADSVDWKEEHSKDRVISRVIQIVSSGEHVTAKKESRKVLALLRMRKSLCVEKGVLYRMVKGKKLHVLPSRLVSKVLHMAHADMGHQGRDRTLALCQERLVWSGMYKDVECFVKQCDRCSRAKAPHLPEKAPMHHLTSSEPLDVVCMDYLGLETSKGGYNSILVLTDHFTKIAVAVPTCNQTAANTAKLIMEHLQVWHTM